MSTIPSAARSTKRFDIIGAFFVLSWLALVGSFVVTRVVQSPQSTTQGHESQRVKITQGTDWRLLARSNKDVGFVKETRTMLKTGWLIEVDHRNIIQLGEMCGTKQDEQCQVFKHNLKVRADKDGRLETLFITSATIKFNDKTEEASWKTTDYRYVFKADEVQEQDDKGNVLRRLKLKGDVTVEEFAHYHISKKETWAKDEQITLQVFNPARFAVEPISYLYNESMELDSIGIKSKAMIFTKSQGARQYAIAVTPEGKLFTNRMSLNTVSTITPAQLARAKSSTILRESDAIYKEVSKTPKKLLSIDWPKGTTATKYNLPGYLVYAQRSFSLDNTAFALQAWRLPSAMITAEMTLTSARQRFVKAPSPQKDKPMAAPHKVVATSNWGNIATKLYTPKAEPLEPLLAATDAVDHQHKAIQDLVPDRTTDFSATGVKIFVKMKETIKLKETAPTPAKASSGAQSQWVTGRGYTLVAAATLRASKIPTRFVYGLMFDKNKKPTPHIWLQAWDGKAFVDYDVTQEDNTPTPRSLQLMTSPTWQPDLLKRFDALANSIVFYAPKEP